MVLKGLRLLLVGISLPFFLLFAPPTFAQQYTVTDLGSLGPQSLTVAAGINAGGQVVGWSQVTLDVPHPFLWTQGGMQDLGVLPGQTNCYATAINDGGEVVGFCQAPNAIQDTQPFRWTMDAGMTALPTPSRSIVSGINNNSDIVGRYLDADGVTGHAFVIRNGAFQELGLGVPEGINDAGQIVGWTGNPAHRAVLWDQDGPHDLGALDDPGGGSEAWAVNADGLVAGWSSTGGPEIHAVLWAPYGIANLGSFGGHSTSARAISGDLVVGYSQTPASALHAFLYDNNGPGYPVDLNDLIAADSGWVLADASGVNIARQIVGSGYASGGYHAFLLTPVRP
jgi:probable HAF family extracellular repeat protein